MHQHSEIHVVVDIFPEVCYITCFTKLKSKSDVLKRKCTVTSVLSRTISFPYTNRNN
jgi:hypothetical protein